MKTFSMVSSCQLAGILLYGCWLTFSVQASGNIDATKKHAWAENIGWVNMAPVSGGVTNGVTVHYDGSAGYLSGHAWGENIGWIRMGDNSGGPYSNSSATDWGVNLGGDSILTGYAWGENVGWIKFDPDHSFVMIDLLTGLFSGDAWGENIGWIRFQGTAPNYSVRTIAFEKQPQGTPNWWLELYGVAEDSDEGDGIPAWQEHVADTDPVNEESYCRILNMVMKPWGMLIYFPSSQARYYTLQRMSGIQTGTWSDVAGQSNIQGQGGVDVLLDSGAVAPNCYRLRVSTSQ